MFLLFVIMDSKAVLFLYMGSPFHLITEIRQTDNGDFKVIYLLAPIVPVHDNVQPEVLLLQSRCHSILSLWHKNSRPQAAHKGHEIIN